MAFETLLSMFTLLSMSPFVLYGCDMHTALFIILSAHFWERFGRISIIFATPG